MRAKNKNLQIRLESAFFHFLADLKSDFSFYINKKLFSKNENDKNQVGQLGVSRKSNAMILESG